MKPEDILITIICIIWLFVFFIPGMACIVYLVYRTKKVKKKDKD